MNIAFAYNVKHSEPSLDIEDQADIDFDAPETIEAIIKTIESLGHTVIRIEADLNAYENLKKHKDEIDLLFNIAEGFSGDARESQIPLFCEMLGIKYTHSTPTTHAIKLNKHYTKLMLKGVGVLVPASQVVSGTDFVLDLELKFPLIVKPNAEGSSRGVLDANIVENEEQLRERVEEMFDGFEGTLLIEEYIDGREFTVGVLGNYPPKVLPIIEQKFDFLPEGMHPIAGYELKWLYEDTLDDPTQAYDCPANIPDELRRQIEDVTLKAYNTLNVREAARVDYRLSEDGKLYFIEINTLPGINPDESVISYFPLASREAGLSFSDVVDTIINCALRKYTE